MPKLTVLIPCKDELAHIAACIASVRPIADEILVADSGSTDGSRDAVRALGDCRLIRKGGSRYEIRRVHANVVVDSGKIGQLVHPLEHHTALDLDRFVAKQHRYANWSALDAFDAGKRSTWLRMLTHAPLRFLQLY